MDDWTQLNPYALTHPKGWTIAKYAQAGRWKYALWQGERLVDFFDESDAAKEEFDRLTRE